MRESREGDKARKESGGVLVVILLGPEFSIVRESSSRGVEVPEGGEEEGRDVAAGENEVVVSVLEEDFWVGDGVDVAIEVSTEGESEGRKDEESFGGRAAGLTEVVL